jgi:hypothetical protein
VLCICGLVLRGFLNYHVVPKLLLPSVCFFPLISPPSTACIARRRLEDSTGMLLDEDEGGSPWAHSFASGEDEGEIKRQIPAVICPYDYFYSVPYSPSCPTGQYLSGSSCYSCPGGQYQDLATQTSCKACPGVSSL